MSHDRDHDHRTPSALPPREPQLHSADCPDRKRPEHPAVVPREPVDPRVHPSRRIHARFCARPA
jgi:hypothetical protein